LNLRGTLIDVGSILDVRAKTWIRTMGNEQYDLAQISKTVEARLHAADEEVLSLVLDRFDAFIRRRLRDRFGSLISDDDADDILAEALYRLWTYRLKYDSGKSSIANWFWLIARSSAIGLLQKKHIDSPIDGSVEPSTDASLDDAPESPELLALDRQL